MTTNREPTLTETVIGCTAALDLAGPEIENLRRHLFASIFDDSPAGAFTAARSADLISRAFADVANALRDQGARDSISYGSPEISAV